MAFRNRIVRISQLIVDVLRTAAPPKARWEISSTTANQIVGYTGAAEETQQGQLQVRADDLGGGLKVLWTILAGPRMTGGSPNGAAQVAVIDQNSRHVSEIVLVADEIRAQKPGAAQSYLVPFAGDQNGGAIPGTGSGVAGGGPWSSTAPPNGTTGIAFTVPQDGTYLCQLAASAYNTVGGNIDNFNWYIDGTLRGQRRHFVNPANTHLACVPQTVPIFLAAGTHYLYLNLTGTGAASDTNDFLDFSWVRVGP